MSWTPVPKNPQRRSYTEPIVVVGGHNKAYLSMVAEQLLGDPDEVVFFAGRNGDRAIRAAEPGDKPLYRRILDPHHSVTVPRSLLSPGHYCLRPSADGLYHLLPASAETAERHLTAKTRRAEPRRDDGHRHIK